MAAIAAKMMAQKAAQSAAGSAMKSGMGKAAMSQGGGAAGGSKILGGINGSGTPTQGAAPGFNFGGAIQERMQQQLATPGNGAGMPTSPISPDLGPMQAYQGPHQEEEFDIRRQWWKPQRVA